MAKPLSRDLSLCRQTYAAFFGGHSHSFSSSVYVLSMQISLPSKGGREISVINLYVVFFFFGKANMATEKKKERKGNGPCCMESTLRAPHISRYLSLSLPTNFTATKKGVRWNGGGGGMANRHTCAGSEYEIFVYF